MTNLETAIQYANDCINDTIPSCVYIKQACNRFLQDLDNPFYYIDEDNIDTLVSFCESFYLTEQEIPKLTQLQPFQKFIICNLFGIYKKKNLQRKYRTSYIEIPRGNAKTQLTIMLALYELLFGTDAQIILAADSIKQVMAVDFDKAKMLVKQIDPSGKEIKVLYNKIVFGNNKLIITSNESKPVDGLSGSYMVVDEMHQMKDLSVYNTLKKSMVKRNDNILFIITTAGNDLNSECYRMHTYCTKVLEGKYDDPSQFAMIWTIDEGDNYIEEKNWYKTNPLLGIAIDKDQFSSAVAQSQMNDQEKASTLSRHFNVWIKEKENELFILPKYVQRASVPLTFNQFSGMTCHVGADLSVNDDITAVSYMYIIDDIYYFLTDYFIPSEALTTKYNKERYCEAVKGGYINIIEGNAIDYDVIINHISERNLATPIELITYDKAFAAEFVRKLEPSFNMYSISQLGTGMNNPIMELQRLFLMNRVRVQDNPITKWMFSNVVLKRGFTGLSTLDKTNADSNKIDGVSSICDSLGGYLVKQLFGLSIY